MLSITNEIATGFSEGGSRDCCGSFIGNHVPSLMVVGWYCLITYVQPIPRFSSSRANIMVITSSDPFLICGLLIL